MRVCVRARARWGHCESVRWAGSRARGILLSACSPPPLWFLLERDLLARSRNPAHEARLTAPKPEPRGARRPAASRDASSHFRRQALLELVRRLLHWSCGVQTLDSSNTKSKSVDILFSDVVLGFGLHIGPVGSHARGSV